MPFKEVRKNFKVVEHKHIIFHFQAGDLEIPNIICFAKIKPIMYFAKFLNAFVKPRNLNFSQKNYIFGISRSPASKSYMMCLCSKSLKLFLTSKNGLNSDYFAKIAHKIAKSKYLHDIVNDSNSPINYLSDDI